MKKILRMLADMFYRMSPSFYYKIRYVAIRRRWPDFKHPQDLSEWLLARMLEPEFADYAKYVDKVLVRDYISSKGLADYLPALYTVWDDASKIDIDALPSAFAIKANNGCGGHIICTDKSKLDVGVVRKRMTRLLASPFSIREPHYKYIKPLIYAEEYIGMVRDGKLPVDYKFHCVKGRVNCILTCSNRSLERHSFELALFDTHWNVLYDGLKPSHNKTIPQRPSHLDQMIAIATKLSEDFDFVRVDLYDVDGKIYFGELTFTPASSLLPYFTTQKLREMANGLT